MHIDTGGLTPVSPARVEEIPSWLNPISLRDDGSASLSYERVTVIKGALYSDDEVVPDLHGFASIPDAQVFDVPSIQQQVECFGLPEPLQLPHAAAWINTMDFSDLTL
jgi:hypothetical protein